MSGYRGAPVRPDYRILVTGSRNWSDEAVLQDALAEATRGAYLSGRVPIKPSARSRRRTR